MIGDYGYGYEDELSATQPLEPVIIPDGRRDWVLYACIFAIVAAVSVGLLLATITSSPR